METTEKPFESMETKTARGAFEGMDILIESTGSDRENPPEVTIRPRIGLWKGREVLYIAARPATVSIIRQWTSVWENEDSIAVELKSGICKCPFGSYVVYDLATQKVEIAYCGNTGSNYVIPAYRRKSLSGEKVYAFRYWNHSNHDVSDWIGAPIMETGLSGVYVIETDSEVGREKFCEGDYIIYDRDCFSVMGYEEFEEEYEPYVLFTLDHDASGEVRYCLNECTSTIERLAKVAGTSNKFRSDVKKLEKQKVDRHIDTVIELLVDACDEMDFALGATGEM